MRYAALVLLFLLNVPVHSQVSIQAVQTPMPPKIDGVVDESLWENAALITDFIQRIPNNGAPMTEKTQVFVMHDEEALFIGLKCYDSQPGKITAKELARDASLAFDDKIHVIIDTYLDKRNAYWFQINPRGCIGDALVSQNGAGFNKSWDGLWEGKAHITGWGWEGEIAIPFKTMSFRRDLSTWGFKLIRQVARKNEQGYWPVANLDSYRFQVSDAGLLTGMTGMSQGLGLDVVPYGFTGTDRVNEEAREYPVDAGLDVFYQITPGLKSALTINTDFAQTEVDDRRINLTRFPLFFEEKRDFFLDGSNYFSFGIDGESDHPFGRSVMPFFSRRLGLDAGGNPMPILGGLKLTGQAGGWNMGLLDIVEDRESGAANSAVGRLARNLGGQSYVGAIGTLVNAATDSASSVVGVDMKIGTSQFLGNKNVWLSLFGLKSSTEGPSGGDHAYGASFFYPNDGLWIVSGFHEIGDNFQAGLGFVPRAGIRQSYFRGGLGQRPKKWGLLQVVTGTQINYITDLANKLLTREVGLKPLQLNFISGETIAFTVYQTFESLENDFAIHSEHSIPDGRYTFWRYTIEGTTAQRRPFYVTARFDAGEFYTGNRSEIVTDIGWKIGVPIALGLGFEHNDVSLADGDFSTDVARLNANVLFSPDVFLYNFVQYDNLSKKLGWQSRFVWIIKPGREVFFVWKSISADPFERFAVAENSTRLKVKYTIRF